MRLEELNYVRGEEVAEVGVAVGNERRFEARLGGGVVGESDSVRLVFAHCGSRFGWML